jgi:hypothetical protein
MLTMFYLSAHEKWVNITVIINLRIIQARKKKNIIQLKNIGNEKLKSREVRIESKGSCYGEKEQTLPRQTAKNIAPEVEESRNFAA